MSTTTLTPADGDDPREFTQIVTGYDTPPRNRTRTLIVPQGDAADQGLRFRRHRTRGRGI